MSHMCRKTSEQFAQTLGADIISIIMLCDKRYKQILYCFSTLEEQKFEIKVWYCMHIYSYWTFAIWRTKKQYDLFAHNFHRITLYIIYSIYNSVEQNLSVYTNSFCSSCAIDSKIGILARCFMESFMVGWTKEYPSRLRRASHKFPSCEKDTMPQGLVGLGARCANSYIPQHILTYNVLHMWDIGICTVCTQYN